MPAWLMHCAHVLLLWLLLSVLALTALTSSTCLLMHAGSITAQSALLDRRVPYYVLPGCDYMLDAGQRCDTSEFFPAVGCCPMGHECGVQQGQGQQKVCITKSPAVVHLMDTPM